MTDLTFDADGDLDGLPEIDNPNQTVKLNLHCPVCERRYPGADRNGGHCTVCHLSFASQTGFDKHRVGKFENRATGQPNTRRCLTTEEMTAKTWTVDEHHVVRMPAPAYWTAKEAN